MAVEPLAGLTVVEISSFVAAPLGGMTLAQLGADVIRVDPVGGGPDRERWPLAPSGQSLYWAELNKGKRSVTADLRAPEGQELISRLVTGSGADGGIVLTNAAGRSWLSFETLVEQRPDVIVVQIEGRHDGRPAVDYTVNAEVGFPMVTGPEEHAGPVNHVLPAWDVACGLYAAVGLLSAERQRRRTGEGSRIRLPLHDVALATAGNLGFLAEAQLGAVRPRIGNHLFGGFARDFGTADGGRVMVVALTRRHFADLAAVTGLTETFAELERLLDADFGRDADRYRHREAIAALVQPWFERHTVAEVEAHLSRTTLLWSRYRRFTDLVDGLGDNPMMRQVDQAGIGSLLAPASPLDWGGERRAVPAPRLGEHTEQVLGDVLGLGSAEIADLQSRAVVRGSQ